MQIIRDTQVSTKELLVFFSVTLILSTAYVLFSGPMVEGGIGREAAMAWYRDKAIVIVWAPMLFALLCAAVFRGRECLALIGSRLKLWKVGWHWWLIALLMPLAMQLTNGVLFDGFVEADFSVLAVTWLSSFAFLFVLIIGEELGWRGVQQSHSRP